MINISGPHLWALLHK